MTVAYSALGRPLFATVGSVQKLANEAFMTMLTRLLERFPGAAFLWTDATGHPGFPALLQRHGLAARCHNVGFVDIAAFAPEIDVHLDSFPYGTAEAALRMLAHGCPTVGMAVKDSLHGYVYGPLLAHGFDDPQRRAAARALMLPPDHSPRLLIADDFDRYVALAEAVARDPTYRAACAAAYQKLYNEILADGGYAAEAWRAALTSMVPP